MTINNYGLEEEKRLPNQQRCKRQSNRLFTERSGTINYHFYGHLPKVGHSDEESDKGAVLERSRARVHRNRCTRFDKNRWIPERHSGGEASNKVHNSRTPICSQTVQRNLLKY